MRGLAMRGRERHTEAERVIKREIHEQRERERE